jgi:hypothetical protein
MSTTSSTPTVSAIARIDQVAGEDFSDWWCGPDNTISIWREFHPTSIALTAGTGRRRSRFADWRPGEPAGLHPERRQGAARTWSGRPRRFRLSAGIERLWQWVADSRS